MAGGQAILGSVAEAIEGPKHSPMLLSMKVGDDVTSHHCFPCYF